MNSYEVVAIGYLIDGGKADFTSSYDIHVITSDLFLFIAGVFLGVLIFLLILPKVLTNVFITPKLKDNGDINMISVEHEKTGTRFIYLNPRTFTQSVGMIISFLLWRISPRKKKRTFHLHVNRTATIIFYVVIAVLSANVLFAIYTIFTVQR